ncbi:Rft-1-domain-containing protein [Sistotremastrum niveocremeum HHB9708]|uniref:Man(5)GlcNAc(2)-PP-dolichol translocation protein RFT1 n=1 Tax=Sistotremastrum niveocremeum HHB9708 TaxID=1314777 RepID=A0A164YAS9_9AGAM|nr:Rft-1-domain-containing protein [Sistotremastrum niveocremeum HHB9708]
MASLGSKALASASSLVFLQIISRLFTFALNQALVRLASPQTYGIASIQFELLLSTILFLSREGVRNALLRSTPEPRNVSVAEEIEHYILTSNVALLPTLAGGPIALMATFAYYASTSPSTRSQPYLFPSIFLYGLSAFLELLAEPLYIRAQNELRFQIRVKAEGTAVAAKTLVTLAILLIADPKWSLVAFALGQLAYGLSILVTFVLDGELPNYWPRKITRGKHGESHSLYFDPTLLGLSLAMTKQSLVKHVLTEGDKFMVSRFSPLSDQGGYALASNYGSLFARVLFQPVEETSRLFFSKTLSADSLTEPSNVPSSPAADVRTASSILQDIVFVEIHFALLMMSFGPPFISTLIPLVLPSRYIQTSAPTILRAYMFYLPAMALNGVLEAFVSSVSTPQDLARQSKWMIFFSGLFVLSGITLGSKMGDVGLVWANVINSVVRAVYCWRYIEGWFRKRGEIWSGVRSISSGVLGVLLLEAVVLRWSEGRGRGPLILIGIGVLCLSVFLATW